MQEDLDDTVAVLIQILLVIFDLPDSPVNKVLFGLRQDPFRHLISIFQMQHFRCDDIFIITAVKNSARGSHAKALPPKGA